MKVKRGSTSVRRLIFVADSSSTVGAGLANLAYNTASLVAYYFAGDLSDEVQITLATATLGTWESGGFVAVDNTNMPGWYEIGIPNAALDGGNEVAIQLRGAANMQPVNIYIELVSIDDQDGVRAGLTALPNANANANGGLPVLSSSGTTLGYTISTLTTYTNNTPQTGDSYARIGATGSGLTSLAPASTALSSATWTNTRAGYLDNIDATVTSRLASVSYTAAPTANQNATALLDLADAITADMTVRDALRLIAAATAAGKTDGGGTDTFTIRNLEDTADAVTATVDADGNRSDITLDLS